MVPGSGPTKIKPASMHGLRELRVLTEQPVTRMHGVRSALTRDRDDSVDIEIGLARRCWPESMRFVRKSRV